MVLSSATERKRLQLGKLVLGDAIPHQQALYVWCTDCCCTSGTLLPAGDRLPEKIVDAGQPWGRCGEATARRNAAAINCFLQETLMGSQHNSTHPICLTLAKTLQGQNAHFKSCMRRSSCQGLACSLHGAFTIHRTAALAASGGTPTGLAPGRFQLKPAGLVINCNANLATAI